MGQAATDGVSGMKCFVVSTENKSAEAVTEKGFLLKRFPTEKSDRSGFFLAILGYTRLSLADLVN